MLENVYTKSLITRKFVVFRYFEYEWKCNKCIS